MPFFAVRKNFHFHKPKVFHLQKALRFALKSLSFSQPKHRSFEQLFTVLKRRFFYVQKAFYSHKTFFIATQSNLFCPPPPISTSLNLLFAKNTAVLLLFALILCCKAGASHRFKSLPAISDEIAVFSIAGYLMNAGCFRKNTVSTGDLNRPRSPEVRKPLVYFWYFSYTRKVRKTFLSQEAPRFRKPRISAPQ